MKKIVVTVLTTWFFLSLYGVGCFHVSASGGKTDHPVTSLSSAEENERIIIGFQRKIDLSLLATIPHTLHYTYEAIPAVSVTIPEPYIDRLKEQPGVAWVERDASVKTETSVDLTTSEIPNWGYEQTILKETIDLKLTGEGVKIGIVDTGVDTTHPDLKISGGMGFIPGQTGFEDDNGHGTHVAGIIAAQKNGIGILGVAPDAEIYALKALYDDGEGTQADVIAAIDWAIQEHLDIINLSLTSDRDTLALRKIIERAEEKGMFVVASSGNDETGEGQKEPDILFPARYPSVISVGALDDHLGRALFSYVGPSLDFSAPGVEILSTYVNGSGYAYASGTSMAAPFITGILALYKQAYPDMNKEQILQRLMENSIDLGEDGWDPVYGYGMASSPFTTFTDLDKDRWYFPFVHELVKRDYIKGFPDGTFQPESFITRGEVVTLIGRILGMEGTNRETTFLDVPKTHYAFGFIASTAKEGIVTGLPDRTFRPNANITRGDAALIIQRAFRFPDSSNQAYFDIESHTYYAGAVNALTEAGIINGYEGQTFAPENPITRSEFSAILAKTINEELRFYLYNSVSE